MGKKLYQLELSVSCTATPAFSLTDSTHSQSCLGLQHIPPPSSERFVYVFVIELASLVTFCIPSWDFPDLIKDVFSLYALR